MGRIVLDWDTTGAGINWRARAAAGAELLDERFPDWAWRVNHPSLNMRLITSCVLTGLYGSYESGARALGFQGYSDEAVQHGFIIEDSVHEMAMALLRDLADADETYDDLSDDDVDEALSEVIYRELNEAWRAEINRRCVTNPELEAC